MDVVGEESKKQTHHPCRNKEEKRKKGKAEVVIKWGSRNQSNLDSMKETF